MDGATIVRRFLFWDCGARTAPHALFAADNHLCSEEAKMETSYLTAIKRSKPSAPAQWLAKNGLIAHPSLDYGCGKGGDRSLFTHAFDPCHGPEMPKSPKRFATIACTYVLNTLFPDEQEEVLNDLHMRLERGGTAFITVRRDLKEDGYTAKRTYQRMVYLPLPIVHETKGYAIYALQK